MSLPRPVSQFSLDLPEARVGIRLEAKVKVSEPEKVRLSTPRSSKPIDLTLNRRVEMIQPLREAHILESSDKSRLFLFATREAASDFIHGLREGREALQRAREAWRRERAETQTQIAKGQAEIAALEKRISDAEDKFIDAEGNLFFTKAKADMVELERRVKDLRLKLEKPEPEMDMGSAISTQFGAEEILTREGIASLVKGERRKILGKYHGLPDESEITVGRSVVLEVEWKRPDQADRASEYKMVKQT